jgi:MerR family transcriptional regulator, mercuric resistance operon regulatory protein
MRVITASRDENLPIGELSRRSGVNIETIRYYERVGMLAPPPRTASGRRIYASGDLRALTSFGAGANLGFRLTRYARCFGSGVRKRRPAAKSARLPRIILKTFGQSSAT